MDYLFVKARSIGIMVGSKSCTLGHSKQYLMIHNLEEKGKEFEVNWVLKSMDSLKTWVVRYLHEAND